MRAPAEPCVASRVTRNVSILQPIHVTESQIKLQMTWQIHQRAYTHLVVWTVIFRAFQDGVVAASLLVQLNAPGREVRPQAPPIGRLETAGQLGAKNLAF